MEYGSFGREKHPLETYLDVIEESISDIRYLISRIPYPSEEPKMFLKGYGNGSNGFTISHAKEISGFVGAEKQRKRNGVETKSKQSFFAW